MKVILKEDIDNLGVIGSVVEVRNGYGRNFLIPRDLAIEANPRNVKQIEHQMKMLKTKINKAAAEAGDLAGKISSIGLTFDVNSGEDGKLFGSVTSKDIAEAIAAQGIEIDKRKINLPEPIKRLGEYEVQIKIRQDVNATVKVEVRSSEPAPAPKAAEEVKTDKAAAGEPETSEEAAEEETPSTEA